MTTKFLTNEECTAYGVMYAHLTANLGSWNTPGRWQQTLSIPGMGVAAASAEAISRGTSYDEAAVQEASIQIDSNHAEWYANFAGQGAFTHAYLRTKAKIDHSNDEIDETIAGPSEQSFADRISSAQRTAAVQNGNRAEPSITQVQTR